MSRTGRTAERLARTLERSDDIVVLADLDARPLWWNVGADRFLSRDRPVDSLRAVVVDGHDLVERFTAAAAGGRTWDGELTLTDGVDRLPVSARVLPDLDSRDRVVGYLLVARDITDHHQRVAALVRGVVADPLTSLPTTVVLHDRVAQAAAHVGRSGYDGAVLVLDIDRFSAVNDTLGPAAGDTAIREVARRLVDRAGPARTVARTGGDQFVVLVDDLPLPDAAKELAEDLLDALRSPLELDAGTVLLSASVGIATLASGESPEELLRRADLALARAKNNGGARYAVYDERGTHATDEGVLVEHALHRRLAEGTVDLRFEPVVDLRSGWIAAATASPDLDWPEVGPGRETLEAAVVRSGLAPTLDVAVITAAIQAASYWDDDVSVAIDLWSRVADADCWAPSVQAACARARVAPGRVVLAVTEEWFLTDPVGAALALRSVRTTGARVLVRGYGGGSASLSLLRDAPLDLVELHPSLLEDLGSHTPASQRALAVVGAVLGIAEVLDLALIAGGLASDDQLETARSLGCSHACGPRIGPAVVAAGLAPWFSAARSGRRPPTDAGAG